VDLSDQGKFEEIMQKYQTALETVAKYQTALETVAEIDEQIAKKFLDKFIETDNEGARRAAACRAPLDRFATDAVITIVRMEQLFLELNDELYEYEKKTGLAGEPCPAGEPCEQLERTRHEGEALENFSQPEHPEQTVQRISVVLGGKLNQHPVSIADTLVRMLVDSSSTKVIGVSRTASENVTKHTKYQHVQVTDLYSDIKGYKDAFDAACKSDPGETIIFYFTLAKYSGTDKPRPTQLKEAQDTLMAAKLFATALKEVDAPCRNRMQVVLTGTAATAPSSQAGQTYKLAPKNYYYAVSKLAQAYELADALGQVDEEGKQFRKQLGDIIGEKEPRIEKTIQSNIKELVDPIAVRQKALMSDKFGVVDDLTIIFSSMHSKKYTDDAKNALLPVVSVFKNVLERLDVAMSLKTAAYKHIVIADRLQTNRA